MIQKHSQPASRASRLAAQLRQYGLLMRLDRPIGTMLLLWPTLWALWIAGNGRPDPQVFLVFVLGVFLLRSAGCVINDLADRNFDQHVARTRQRPLAAGKVSYFEALFLFFGLMLIAFGLVLSMNRLTIYMAVGGAALASIYPFAKRITHLPQLVLGAAFGWGVPMAFAAQTGADFYWYGNVPKDRNITPEFGRQCLHGTRSSPVRRCRRTSSPQLGVGLAVVPGRWVCLA